MAAQEFKIGDKVYCICSAEDCPAPGIVTEIDGDSIVILSEDGQYYDLYRKYTRHKTKLGEALK